METGGAAPPGQVTFLQDSTFLMVGQIPVELGKEEYWNPIMWGLEKLVPRDYKCLYWNPPDKWCVRICYNNTLVQTMTTCIPQGTNHTWLSSIHLATN